MLGRIKEVCGTQQVFAALMGITPQTINAKLKGKATWKQCEIIKACSILGIKPKDIPIFFFDVEFGISKQMGDS